MSCNGSIRLASSASPSSGSSLRARPPPPSSPKGTFTLTGPDGLPWGLTFDGKGRFLVTRGGNEAVQGAYKVTGDEVDFRDEKGPLADEAAGTGAYRWTLDGGKITFTKIKDANGGRSQTLTAGAWEKKKD
jgi:hypothetical protein